MKTLFRVVIVGTVLTLLGAAAVGGWWYQALWGSHSTTAAEIEISPGQSARQVLSELEDLELLPSAMAGRIYLRGWARGRAIHYGRFVFSAPVRPVDVLERILDGEVEMFSVTIVEGTDTETIKQQFIDLGVGSDAEWDSLVDRVEWVAAIAPEAPSLEGFFFPDTYRFAVGVPAETVARHLVDQFSEVWREESGGRTDLWASALEITTLASLVEAETSLEEERGRIAGVFANRLRRGMLLQCDPTVVFALKRHDQWSGRLLRVHWEFDDPYNTYRYAGLPPGPINSPGRASLAAALNPDTTSYLYFVAKPGGGHAFSKTLGEHNRAVARLFSSRR